MMTTYVVAVLITVLIGGLVLWVTKKAYSRKWEDDE